MFVLTRGGRQGLGQTRETDSGVREARDKERKERRVKVKRGRKEERKGNRRDGRR